MVGARLKQARELAGLTQSALARKIDSKQPHISAAENDVRPLSPELLTRVAEVTGFPTGFFERRGEVENLHLTVALRSKASLTATERHRAMRAAELVLDQMISMRERVGPLPLRIGSGPRTTEEAVHELRSVLGLDPNEPVTNLLLRLERAGVLVLCVPLAAGPLDAFSDWVGRDAVMWLLDTSAGDRQNWSVAHEMGHLLMRSRDCDIADGFARRFLLPESALTTVDEATTLQEYALLKRHWQVSMQALVRSAFVYGAISKDRYHGLFRQMSARGERLRERLAVAPQKPRGFRKLAEELWGPSPVPALSTDAQWPETFAADVLSRHATAAELPSRRRRVAGESLGNVIELKARRP